MAIIGQNGYGVQRESGVNDYAEFYSKLKILLVNMRKSAYNSIYV